MSIFLRGTWTFEKTKKFDFTQKNSLQITVKNCRIQKKESNFLMSVGEFIDQYKADLNQKHLKTINSLFLEHFFNKNISKLTV